MLHYQSDIHATWPIEGAFGVLPIPVQNAVSKLSSKIESNPDHFHMLGYAPLLLDARRKMAHFIGAELDEVVMIPNTSLGINVVLRNLDWEEGDTLISCKVFAP